MLTRRRFVAAATSTWALAHAARATAQAGNPGRICAGFPPGSSADNLARLLAQKLGSAGQQFIVENRPGAGGRLAVESIKTSSPDGQSLLVTPDVMMVLYPHVFKTLTYDPVRDFRPVTTLATVPIAFAIGPLVPASVRTLADFAKWCRANPQSASFGTSGAGTSLHFTGVMFARASNFEFTHVPYRGANLAAQDTAAGQIASCVGVLTDLLPLAQGGKMRLLGVSTPARSRFAPDVPTFLEAGFKDIESLTWFGLYVPARTPDDRFRALHAATVAAFQQADVAETLGKFAFEPKTMPSEQFAELMRSDSEHWRAVVKQVGYTATE
jgi:tripartite-type tricarboxylate transporter receptor subunit TctC